MAKDLPPLTEKLYFCEMTEEHKQFYLSEKNKIRNQIFENIEKNGITKSGFVILKGLTMLRQLANHPIMVDPSYEMNSGKFDEVIRNIESLIEENHKVLLFSSFVKHLRIFSDYFKSNYWDYSILTGQTHNREKTIKEFQDYNSKKLFLISLKAGGVGLNLTQADYVFLLDPWWNPASEDQAISRAHRIGQKKNVFVYKFITIGTIEEKIVQLQQKKSKLANMFINSQNPLKGLSLNNVEELFQ